MKKGNRSVVLALLLVAGLAAGYVFVAARPQITFFETYGYQSDNHWVVPVQLRVWERGLRQRGLERSLAKVAGQAEELTGSRMGGLDEARFRSRIASFVADQEGAQTITIAFDKDAKEQRYSITDPSSGEVLRSNRNGRVDGQFRIPLDVAEELLRAQGSSNGYLTYHAVGHGHTGKGRLRLIPDTPGSVSVISDIDDTIKVTEVPAGHRVMFLNTFAREFRSAPGMSDRYKQFGDVPFHYVSGGPWQLYEPVFDFLPGEGFPGGSVHMREFPLVLTEVKQFREFMSFIFDKAATAAHKKQRIREIMSHFKNRSFVFVGDSGEADPEVYREIKNDRDLGPRVQAIYIRTVTEPEAGRLDGMEEIEATIVKEGKSEFDQ